MEKIEYYYFFYVFFKFIIGFGISSCWLGIRYLKFSWIFWMLIVMVMQVIRSDKMRVDVYLEMIFLGKVESFVQGNGNFNVMWMEVEVIRIYFGKRLSWGKL